MCSKLSIVRSPTHLVSFRRSRFSAHLTELHLRGLPLPVVRGAPAQIDSPTSMDLALASAGEALERKILTRLSHLTGAKPFTIPRNSKHRYELTANALLDGVPIVHQPALADGHLLDGYADILVRNSHNPFAQSSYPPDVYSVIEVKLSSTLKADYALQAAAYTDMADGLLKKLNLPAAGNPYLWLASAMSEPHPLKTVDVQSLYESVRRAFDTFLISFDPYSDIPPIDAPLRDLRPWSNFAQILIEDTDSLLQIAGIRRADAHKLQRAGISTMSQLADMSIKDIKRAVDSVGRLPYETLQKQASLQIQTKKCLDMDAAASLQQPQLGRCCTAYEVLPTARSSLAGLQRLPSHHSSDVYFDIEGFPLIEGGLEYLLGAFDVGSGTYHSWWAHDRRQEETQFAALVDWLWSTRLASHVLADSTDAGELHVDGPHVYHYGNYELSALRRLAARAETSVGVQAGLRLDKMLDMGLFVDIYKVVKTSLRIGEPSYSIKSVEKIVGVSRAGAELADAESSVGMYHEWRCKYLDINGNIRATGLDECDQDNSETREERFQNTLLRDIEKYNRQDCESLEHIVQWLRKLAKQREIDYIPRPRPTDSDDSSNSENSISIPSSSKLDTDATVHESMTNPQLAKGACGSSPTQKLADSSNIMKAQAYSVRLLHKAEMSEDKQFSDLCTVIAHLLQFHVKESGPARAQFGERVFKAAVGDYAALYFDDQAVSQVQFHSHASETAQVDDRPAARYKCRRSKALYHFDSKQPVRWNANSSWAFIQPENARQESDNIKRFARINPLSSGCLEVEFSSSMPAMDETLDFPPRGSLISCDELVICPASLRQCIVRYAHNVLIAIDNGDPSLASVESQTSKLVTNFLLKRGYKKGSSATKTSSRGNTELVDIIAKLTGDTFVIQGPPGTGKSTIAAKLITELIQERGKTVAVSSNSHAAIDNLLRLVSLQGIPSDRLRKVGPVSESLKQLEIKSEKRVADVQVQPLSVDQDSDCSSQSQSQTSFAKRHAEKRVRRRRKSLPPACLVGATAYGLSSSASDTRFDYLFVDEAGQVPLANFVAMASSARAAVLIGDQQQLEMPLVGQHPECVKKSCMSYFLGPDTAIVPLSMGLFLDKSYRMPPSLCQFISRTIYKDALGSATNTASHTLDRRVLDDFASSFPNLHPVSNSLIFIDRDMIQCGHTDLHTVRAGKHLYPREARIVRELYIRLVGAGYSAKGKRSIVGTNDILVIAPYNVQVTALKSILPEGARVGTIDKFQGQEAAVVLVSTCIIPENEPADSDEVDDVNTFSSQVLEAGTSSHTGIQFALSRNRLNVALSRAQVQAIVVGPNDVTISQSCKSLEQAKALSFYSQIVKEGGQTPRKRGTAWQLRSSAT